MKKLRLWLIGKLNATPNEESSLRLYPTVNSVDGFLVYPELDARLGLSSSTVVTAPLTAESINVRLIDKESTGLSGNFRVTAHLIEVTIRLKGVLH